MKFKCWTFRLWPVEERRVFRGKDSFTLARIASCALQFNSLTLHFAKRWIPLQLHSIGFSTVELNRLLRVILCWALRMQAWIWQGVTFQRLTTCRSLHTCEQLVQSKTEHETCYGDIGGICDSHRRRRCLACLTENRRKFHKTSGIWDEPWEMSSSKDEVVAKRDQNGGKAINEGSALGTYESIKRKTVIQCGWNAR